MKLQSFNEKFKVPSKYELILGSIILVLIILGVTLHWTEALVNLLYTYKHLPIDVVVITLTILGFFFMVYTTRRKKESTILFETNRESQSNVKEHQDRFERLMNASTSVIYSTQAFGHFPVLYMSNNIKTVLGYEPSEFYQDNFWTSLLHPDDSAYVWADLAVSLQQGHMNHQYRFKHKDGTWRWMQNELRVIYKENNEPDELIGTWKDITDQKNAEDIIHKSEERFSLVSRATKDVIYDWDIVTNGLWMSDEVFGSLGYEKDTTVIFREWWESKIHRDDHERIMVSVKRTLQQKEDNWMGEYRFLKNDGTYAIIFDRGFIVYTADEQPLRWIGCIWDISVLKQVESELRIAKEKAEESVKTKSEFLANMSHEIRTPLNGIIGMTELALETDLSQEQKRYLETVKLSSETLLSLINDILDFSKIDAGKLDLSPVPFSLRDEIPRVLQPLGLKASFKNLEFIFRLQQNVPDLLIGDVLRLQQIVSNLAGNAIKFTNQGEVILGVQLKEMTDNQVTLLFSVTDTGIGIAANKLSHVFQEFSQADSSTTREYGGTGLGLSITKRLIEMMGGSVWVESEEEKGSVFYFTIQMELQPESAKSSVTLNPALEGTPVLIVEDNRLARENLYEIVKQFGMRPVAVSNGEDAILELEKAAMRQIPFPVMLLDISLAGVMDGFDVAENIQGNSLLEHTDIIVISKSQKASDRERFGQMGINRFFNKPFSQSDLLDNIQELLVAMKPHLKQEFFTVAPVKKIEEVKFETSALNILLVEDNLVNQEVASSMLIKRGHSVTIASNGEDAIENFKKTSFDLILMDVQMPKMNGYQATQKIRKLEELTGSHISIVGLTANAMKGDKEKCLDAGMDDYVTKPVRINDLINVLGKIKAEKQPVHEETDIHFEIESTINLNWLLEMLDGDKQVFIKILTEFPTEANAIFDVLEVAVSNDQLPEIECGVHSLKGQCLMAGMQMVAGTAQKIETLAHEKKLEEIKILMPQLRSELKQALEHLNAACELIRSEQGS